MYGDGIVREISDSLYLDRREWRLSGRHNSLSQMHMRWAMELTDQPFS